jgi:hypothetical protein
LAGGAEAAGAAGIGGDGTIAGFSVEGEADESGGAGGAGGAGEAAVAGGVGGAGAAAGVEQSAGLLGWQQVTGWQQQHRDLRQAEAVSNDMETINVQTNTICRRRRMASLLKVGAGTFRRRIGGQSSSSAQLRMLTRLRLC